MEIKNSPYYTRQNLEIILGSNRRTLDYRINKLIEEGVLKRIKSGFYLNKLLLDKTNQKEEFLEYVGGVLKYPSYVSLEYALSKSGLLPESIFTFTYVTTKKTGNYSSGNLRFKYRNIKSELFFGYETRSFLGSEYYFAKPAKALFDFIYLTPLEDTAALEQLLFSSRINWQVLRKGDKREFLDFCARAESVKMQKVVETLKEREVL
ncbi:hypothetical protein GF360_03510 [candidate division WWE3 bacterium]|nr:hypothetical protein [candidate division WWE3 bacterium]